MSENPLVLESRRIAYDKRSHPDYVSDGMELVSLIKERLPRTTNLMGLIQELAQSFKIHKILEVLLSTLSLDRYSNLIKETYDIDLSMVRKMDQNKFTTFRSDYRDESKANSQIESMPTSPLPKFVVENVDVLYEYKYDGTLYTLFDSYEVSTAVPMIAYKGYYKIYTPLYHRLNELSFKMDSDQSTLQMVVNNHIIKLNEEGKGVFTLTIPSIIDPSILSLNPIRKQAETNLKGFYSLEALNQYIVADIVTEDPFLSEYLVVNDQVRSTDTSFQINYKHPYSSEHVESTLRIYGGTARLIVRSATTMAAVEQYQYLMERVMGLYNRNSERLTPLYAQYGFTFEKLDKKLYMKSLYPEVFDAGYSRRCQPAIRVPMVIDDESHAQGRSIMRFPMDNVIAPQQMYVCSDEVYKFPGLLKTTANTFGFQPCCFKRDQTSTRKYKAYFEQDETETDAPVYMKRTSKILEGGEFGYLPTSMISYYFEAIGVDVRRKGIAVSPNSFIECLEQTLGTGRDPRQVRLTLTEFLPLFTQTMFDLSLTNIRNFINSDEYFDPQLTVGVLEAKYDCNIIVMVKDDTNPDGGIQVPRSAQGYRHYRRSGPIVVVYVHIGSEKDKLTYPHCELLVRMDGTREVTRFDEVPMVSELESVIIGPPLQIPVFVINSQVIDSMGNVRILQVQYNDTVIQLHTPPLPPLPVEIVEYKQIHGTDQYQARSFLETYGIFTESTSGVSYGTIGEIEYKIYHNNIMFDDTFEIAVRNEQSARKLVNWTQWVYSLMNEQNPITVDQFFTQSVDINPNIDMLSLGPFFTRESAVFRRGRLQVPSQAIFDKMRQYMGIQIIRRSTYIRSFHTRNVLEHYYQSIADFTQNYNYIITRSTEAPTVIPIVSPSEIFRNPTLPVATTISDRLYIAVDS